MAEKVYETSNEVIGAIDVLYEQEYGTRYWKETIKRVESKIEHRAWSVVLGPELMLEGNVKCSEGDWLDDHYSTVSILRSHLDYLQLQVEPDTRTDGRDYYRNRIRLNGDKTEGMKLTKYYRRLLKGYVEKYGECSGFERDAIEAVEDYERALGKKTGWIVRVSRRPLDIITASMNVSYESCYAMHGCCEGGPLDNLANAGTVLIAYAFKSTREFNGVDIPRKNWRQWIFIPEDRKGIIGMKQYPDSNYAVRDKALSMLQAALWGSSEVETQYAQANIFYHRFYAGYNDPTDYTLRLCGEEKTSNRVDLYPDHICPDCGHNTSVNGVRGSILCGVCKGDMIECCLCGGILDEENDSYYTVEGDYVCEDCYQENYTCCDNCGEETHKDYVFRMEDTGNDFCEYCADNHAYTCDKCGEYREDLDSLTSVDGDSYCDDCLDHMVENGKVVECECCGGYTREENSTTQVVCEDCA